MTSFTQARTALRRAFANLEAGFDRLVCIQFRAPWRAPRRCAR